MFGIGLAFGVLIDATIVRAVLVPAAIVLLGDANWWLPSWLDRIIPRMQLDVAEPEMEEELDAPSLATER
jgi:RND superfamily putative drug exporter